MSTVYADVMKLWHKTKTHDECLMLVMAKVSQKHANDLQEKVTDNHGETHKK